MSSSAVQCDKVKGTDKWSEGFRSKRPLSVHRSK